MNLHPRHLNAPLCSMPAERLNGDSRISGANKDKLQAAIDKANGVLNQVPATVRELEEAYHELNRVIREVRNSIGGGGGSGGSGGRGSGGAAGQTTDRYPSYTVGSDGTWQQLDAGSAGGAFTE